MTTFEYDVSKSAQKFIKRKIIFILIGLAPWIFDQFYDINFVTPNYLNIMLPYLAATLYFDLKKTELYRIEFDEDKKRIRFFVKTPFGNTRSQELTSADAQMDICSRKKQGKRKIYLIELTRRKRNIASLYAQKDGFSSENLYYIYKAAENLKIETNVS